MSFAEMVFAAQQMVAGPLKGKPVVYFLRLHSGLIYVGSSLELEQRLEDHVSGQACRTTELDPPMEILRVEVCPDFVFARRREAQLKRGSRTKKLALIAGDGASLRRLARSREGQPKMRGRLQKPISISAP